MPTPLANSALALLITFAGAACASPANRTEDPAPKDVQATKKEDDGKAAEKIEKKQRELDIARLELDMSGGKAELALVEAREAVRKARVDLESAERALAMYRDKEGPDAIAGAELSLNQSEMRVETNQQDLQQMKNDYENAGFAVDELSKVTGEIVVWRTERQLEFSRRRLALTRSSTERTKNHTVPNKIIELESALDAKRVALARAEAKLEQTPGDSEISKLRAELKIHGLELELAELRKKAEEKK